MEHYNFYVEKSIENIVIWIHFFLQGQSRIRIRIKYIHINGDIEQG